MIRLISQYSGNEAIIVILAFTMSVLIAITLHEFAHAYTAYKQGDNTPKAYGRISFNPLDHIDPLGMIMFALVGFGWAKPVPTNPMNYKEYRKGIFLVSIAGVTVNILLFIMFTGYYVFFDYFFTANSNSLIFFTKNFLLYSSQINLVLAIFNLIPIAPLDGFNILNAIFKRSNKLLDFLARNGFIILLILLFTGVLRRFVFYMYVILSQPIFDFFNLFI